MSLFNKWKELIITQDGVKFDIACTVLKNSGIVFKGKSQYIGHGNRRTGKIGSLGENSSFLHLYQIFVQQKDFDLAKSLIFCDGSPQ